MRSTLPFVLCIALFAMAGCQSNKQAKAAEPKPDWEWDGFAPSPTAHSVPDIAHAQAAAGAREDATLLPRHFTNAGKLNSLGIVHLEMIFSDAEDGPPALYLNWPTDDPMMSARRSSVEEWLKGAGVDLAAVAMKDGANPAMGSPAAGNLTRMWKTERPGGAVGSDDSDTGGMTPQIGAPQSFQQGGTSP